MTLFSLYWITPVICGLLIKLCQTSHFHVPRLTMFKSAVMRSPKICVSYCFHYRWFPRQMTSGKRAQTRHNWDLGSASYWLNQISHAVRPVRSTTQILWVVTHHQCGIYALVSQTSFGGENSGSVTKCRLFSQAIVFKYSLEYVVIPGGFENNSLCKIWGVNSVLRGCGVSKIENT